MSTFAAKNYNCLMKRLIPFLPWLGALLLIAVALLLFEGDLLWKVQQNNLFLDTRLFFRDQMLVPAGFLSYVSCYFTQFFYHPWLGVLILCGWWLLLMWLTKRAFRIPDTWASLALIPVAALLIAGVGLGYWHYFMRLQGYFFVPTIGTTAAVAMLWVFRAMIGLRMKPTILGIVWIVVATVVGYPLLGIYALAAVLLMGIWVWRLTGNRTQNVILSVVALLCIIAVPLVCYRYVYYQTFFDDLWTTGLPITNVLKNYQSNYIPYYILGGVYFLFTVCGLRFTDNDLERSKRQGWMQKPLYRWGVQGVLVIALMAVVWHWWYKDENFHHELAMQHCIESADWEGVIREGQKQGDIEPTRTIIMMHNLALSRLGRIDEIFDFPWGRKIGDPAVPYDMLNQVFSKMIYYQYGLLNDCHRKCMEDGVEFGWSVETLQYMARCYILSGERRAAKMILDKLHRTTFCGEWADEMVQLLDDLNKRADDKEMGPVTRMLQYKNALGLDEGNIEKYLMNVLAYQDSPSSYFQEQAVLATLWKRNPQLFWTRFSRYLSLNNGKPIPRIFQEAALLFGNLERNPLVSNVPLDKGVVDNYAAFVNEGKKYHGQQAVVGRTALHPFFGNTYYFYYYFLQDMK